MNIDLDAIDAWVGKGAQLSDTVRSLVNRVRRQGNTPTASDATASAAASTGAAANG